MAHLQPPPQYSEEEVQQALASVYALLLRAARRQRLAETRRAGDEAPSAGDGKRRPASASTPRRTGTS